MSTALSTCGSHRIDYTRFVGAYMCVCSNTGDVVDEEVTRRCDQCQEPLNVFQRVNCTYCQSMCDNILP